MGRIRRSRNQREEVSIITQEWVDTNCARVTERDMNVLRLLSQYSLLSSRHIHFLTPAASKSPAFHEISRGQQRCNDRLRILYDLHCINKYSPLLPPGSGTSVQYCWLDRAGAKLLGIESFRRRQTLPQDYLHRTQIMDLYCDMIALERNKELEIRYASVEPHQKTWPMIPDLCFIFRANQRGFLLFVEMDRCEKKEKEEISKIEDYRTWQLSNRWLQEEWARVTPSPRFPRLLYVFDEEKPRWQVRAKRFRQAADKCGLRFGTCGRKGFSDTIKALALS